MPLAAITSGWIWRKRLRAWRHKSKNGPGVCASAWGAIRPAAAHDASWPRRPRSSMVTATPSRASRQATELPMMPPPMIRTFDEPMDEAPQAQTEAYLIGELADRVGQQTNA